jgi:hypothetical protein
VGALHALSGPIYAVNEVASGSKTVIATSSSEATLRCQARLDGEPAEVVITGRRKNVSVRYTGLDSSVLITRE